MNTARDQIVSCAFRRRADEVRRLDIEEPFRIHELPDKRDKTAPEHDLFLKLRSSEVQISVAEPQLLACLDPVKNMEGGCLGLAQDPEIGGVYLHGPCLKILIDSARSLLDGPCHGDTEFAPERPRKFTEFSSLENDLHDPCPVSHIHEHDPALIAALCDPAHESDLRSDHLLRDLSASHGSL